MPTPLPHRAQSNNCQARKPAATQYKGTSLGTSCLQPIKQTLAARLAAIPPAVLNQKFHDFHLAPPSSLVEEPKPEIPNSQFVPLHIHAWVELL